MARETSPAMAQRLSSLLDPSRIDLNVKSTQRAPALKEVARQLDGHPDVSNYAGFYRELLQRERVDTTCLGNEVALPHARSEFVKQMVLAVGRSASGVHFERADENVRLIFVLGTPKANVTDYLQVVSSLCRLLKAPAHREALLAATTPEAFIAAIQQAEDA
jgi:mannitol/fructose-specific phosphotransferase system IIA component (Ntr-type)